MRAQQATDAVADHGEGVIWDTNVEAVRWVDMLAGDVLTVRADGGPVERMHLSEVVAAIRPRTTGGLVAAFESSFALVAGDGTIEDEVVAFADGGMRMNDGACDAQGRFYCGSMAYDMSGGRAVLFRFDTDHRVVPVLTGVGLSNGLAWSEDGSEAFYVDSLTGGVDVLTIGPDGEMTARRRFVDIDPTRGMPDGLTLDAEGGVWVALWGGGCVLRFDAHGRETDLVKVPVSRVTTCAFGGRELTDLYISTSKQEPAAGDDPAVTGALFVVSPGVAGLPTWVFEG